MNRQRKIEQNLGKDTHVRSYNGNVVKPQSFTTYQVIAGEIVETQPEPIFKQGMVGVQLSRGGKVTSVAYPNAFIEPVSGNFHGLYEGPVAGQMVLVGFENGNAGNPVVINKYPYQGIGDTVNEQSYTLPLTSAGFDSEDIVLGHRSGSYLSLNTGVLSGKTPGSCTFVSIGDFELQTNAGISMTAETSIELVGNTMSVDTDTSIGLTSDTITLTVDTQIELNGNSNYAVKYTELKSAFDTLKDDFNNFINLTYNIHQHATAAPGAPSNPSVTGTPTAADMEPSKNDKVLM